MRKVFLLFSLGLLLTNGLKAQSLYVTTGTSLFALKYNAENLNNFAQTFNAYYGAAMVDPYKLHDGKVSDVAWKSGLYIMKEKESGFVLSMTYSYNKAVEVNTCSISSGFEQEYELFFKDHDIAIEMGYSLGGLMFANLSTAFLFRGTQLNYWTILQDGSRSMGFEYDINGVYKTFTPSIEIGATLGLKLGRVFIPFRLTYPIAYMEEFQTSLLDFDANRYRQHDFPRDFGLYIQDTMGEQAEQNTIYSSDFKGPRFSMGIEFAIFKTKS